MKNRILLYPGTAILEYMGAMLKCSSKVLEKDLFKINSAAAKRGVYLQIDFKPMGDNLYSEVLCRELWFLQSVGSIKEKDEVFYLTSRGLNEVKKRSGAFYYNVPKEALTILCEEIENVKSKRTEKGTAYTGHLNNPFMRKQSKAVA